MITIDHIKDFIEPLVAWASTQSDIRVVALVGSYARGTATDTSDIDIMLLVDDPRHYIAHTAWLSQFGTVEKQQIENYGLVTSLRVWYQNSYEVEFGLTTPRWGQSPDDEETQRIIQNGILILFERKNL